MKKAGFTMTEVMMALGIFGMVMAGGYAVYISCHRTWYRASVAARAGNESNLILQKIVYGEGGTNGLRAAVRTNIVVVSSQDFWSVTYRNFDGAAYRFRYLDASDRVDYADLNVDSNLYHVISTRVSTSSIRPSGNGLSITVQTYSRDGRFAATNTATTYVHYRN